MRHQQSPEGRSVRLLRVGEQIRHVLADVLGRGGLRDPALAELIITVTEVRVTPDLRHATAFVRTLGASDEGPTLATLARNARPLRAELARAVRLKYVPELHFRADESFDAAAKVDEVLRRPEVARDLGDRSGPANE